MRILFVVPYVPTQIRVRPYSLLRALLDQGHRVTLATLWNTEAEREFLATWEQMGVEILAEPLPRLQSMQNCLLALPTQTPLQAVYCWHPRFAQKLERLIGAEQFDVAHVEHLRGARYGLALKAWGLPVVWDSVDCISHLFAQAIVNSRSLFGKWVTRLELGRTRGHERRLVERFGTVLVTSEVDKQALLQLSAPGTDSRDKIKVLPNGVDQSYFAPNGLEREPETLVFSGKMSYHANVTMALHLVQDIMPQVWARRPTVKLTIVGQNPPPAVKKLEQNPQVTVTGYVPDMRPYLQQATVAVVPSAYGAGIQNKVLEAMACGTPVVATDRAVAALAAESGRDLLVAHDTQTFAAAVLDLLDDPARRARIGQAGRTFVETHHSWATITARLAAIYEEAIDATTAREAPLPGSARPSTREAT